MKNKRVIKIKFYGFAQLLTVLFIGLKLTDHIDWSWLWVLSPLWLPAVVVISILLIMFLFMLIVAAASSSR